MISAYERGNELIVEDVRSARSLLRNADPIR